jgi:hypothetical protein
MMRAACRAGGGGIFILLLWLPSVVGQAAPSATLRVRPLHAAGGEGGVERELPMRLTTALRKFLRDHAEPTVHIEMANLSEQAAAREVVARYALEGDLSYASGPDGESGRYLLVTRLIREGRPSALIGQWAGSASSLRYLTANLRRDPRVHPLGLIGEIGSRVLAAVAADAAGPDGQWRTLVARLHALRSPMVTPIQAEAPYAARSEIVGGTLFRLRFQTAKGMRFYLLTSGNDSGLEVQPLPWAEAQSASPRTVQADSQAVRLPEGTREAWLLCRTAAPEHNVTMVRTHRRFPRSCRSRADEDDAPVHVLNGVGPGTAAPKASLTLLLAEVAHDSPFWRVLRLRVTTAHK